MLVLALEGPVPGLLPLPLPPLLLLLFLFYVIYALRSVSFDSFRCGGTEQKLTQIDDGNAIVPLSSLHTPRAPPPASQPIVRSVASKRML